MGGWNALLYKRPERVHPRTFDVDLLLPPKLERAAAETLIRTFLDCGFAQSAKHAFQLIREVNLAGNRFAYNVDLLHPFLESRYPEMFLDLLEFHVPLSDFDRSTMNFSKSIVLPGIDQFIWAQHSTRTLSIVEAGARYEIKALFPDPVAFVCSKALALGGPKRPRDAYDIFVTLEGQGVASCAAELYEIARTSPTARRCLQNLRDYMKEMPRERDGKKLEFVSSFQRNSFFNSLPPEVQWSYITDANNVVNQFLAETNHFPAGMEVHA